MSKMERNTLALRHARSALARHESDCGSSEVQGACNAAAAQRMRARVQLAPDAPPTSRPSAVAVLTRRIAYMTEHLQVHPKDKHSRLGLMGMLATRRKLLQYLRRTDGDRYANVIATLGLKDRGE